MKKAILLLCIIFIAAACGKEQAEVVGEPKSTATTFTLTFENVMQDHTFFQAGTTDLIQPGELKAYSFVAGIGMHLSFTTMLVESNDLFYGFGDNGLPLYDEEGRAITGDVTEAVRLWDAGTEINEILGEGSSQAPRQEGVNFGEREDGVIQLVDSLQDELIYPVTDSMLQLSLAYDGDNQFTLTIENLSNSQPMMSALSSGIFVIHQADKYLFKAGDKASAGLETMAEDGDNTILWNQIMGETGFSSIIGTGVYLAHQASHPIFTNGEQDREQGLEILAEYGNPETLFNTLKNRNDLTDVGIFNDPVGNNILNLGGKLIPGDKYVFAFEAEIGDYLSIANMLVETNDLFFAFEDTGLELFPNGQPINGEVTNQIQLWDAGTEANEFPGAGSFQPIRNGNKEGLDEGGNIRPVNDEFIYPAVNQLVRVLIESE